MPPSLIVLEFLASTSASGRPGGFWCSGSLNLDLNSDLESEPDAQSEGLLSEEEDEYPVQIGRLATGWEKVEIGLFGHSSTKGMRRKLQERGLWKEGLKKQGSAEKLEAQLLRACLPGNHGAISSSGF